MALVHSFEPIIGCEPRILILGSMPGIASLEAVQYYAHPRNAFWPIMSDLFGIDINCSYPQRIEQISEHPVVLWDTLKACHREGSLDSRIQKHQLQANDIPSLLEKYQQIKLVAFNGATSEKYFRQLVKPLLSDQHAVDLMRLPSTSPANAGLKLEDKQERWRVLLNYL